MNDVEPLAESRSCVAKPSSAQATSRSAHIGHQPGNGEWSIHAHAPAPNAAIQVHATTTWSRVSRAMKLSGRDLAPEAAYCQVCPSDLPNAADRNRAAAVSQLIINIERHLPSGTPSLAGKWLASLWRA